MKNLKLNTGYQMPILGLGTWKSAPNEVYQAIRTAIKLGYRHFDCAAIYGNEKEVGEAFADAFKDGDVKREEIFVTSKLWNANHKKEDVLTALRKTLSDLQLDYLDLYLVHWPVALKKESDLSALKAEDFYSLEEVPLSETWAEMEKAVDFGAVRSIGVSNYSIKKLEEMKSYAEIPAAVNQVESHPFLQQLPLVEYCKKHGIVMTAYAPLASRDRPAEFKASNEPALLDHPVIMEIAEKHNATPAQVLIAWSIERDVVVIPKSTSEKRLAENFAAKDLVLDAVDNADIAAIERGFRYVTSKAFEMPQKGYTEATIWD